MKRSIRYILVVIVLMCYGVYFLFFKPTYLRKYVSPDQAYELWVYQKPKLFSAPGDGSTYCALLKLVDQSGKELNQAEEDCPVLTNDIEVRWEMEKQYVWYTRGGYLSFDANTLAK